MKNIMALWTLAFLVRTDCDTYCDAPRAIRGEPANITCHFDDDIGKTKASFRIHHWSPHTKQPEVPLVCMWPENRTLPNCMKQTGYSYDPVFTKSLTLQIISATENFTGGYSCQRFEFPDEAQEPCILKIDQEVTCDSTSAVQEEAANITCHFDVNINKTKTSFGIKKTQTSVLDPVILACSWAEDGEDTKCFYANKTRFRLIPPVTSTATLQILSVTEEDIGEYECWGNVSWKTKTCNLRFAAPPTDLSTANTATTTENTSENTTENTPKKSHVDATAVGVVSACLGVGGAALLALYCCRQRIWFLVCGGEEDHEAPNNRPVSGDVGGSDSHNGREEFEDAGRTSLVENPPAERHTQEEACALVEVTRRPDTEPKTENATLLRRKNTVPIESN